MKHFVFLKGKSKQSVCIYLSTEADQICKQTYLYE